MFPEGLEFSSTNLVYNLGEMASQPSQAILRVRQHCTSIFWHAQQAPVPDTMRGGASSCSVAGMGRKHTRQILDIFMSKVENNQPARPSRNRGQSARTFGQRRDFGDLFRHIKRLGGMLGGECGVDTTHPCTWKTYGVLYTWK